MSENQIKHFLTAVRRAVTGTANPRRVLTQLRGLGFVEVPGGRCGHHGLRHPLTGAHKLTLGSSPSDYRRTFNFVSQVRHAVWTAQAQRLAI